MRYLAGFIVFIALIIFVFVLIFRGGGDPEPQPQARLIDRANTSTEVRMTEEFAITADQTHRQVVITVGQNSASLTFERGYEGDVIRTQSYTNNPTAYAHFLRALDIAGYTNGDDTEANRDWRGYCPQGRRYIYEIVDGTEVSQRYWSTTCGNKFATLKGQSNLIRQLFVQQIPDYNALIREPMN